VGWGAGLKIKVDIRFSSAPPSPSSLQFLFQYVEVKLKKNDSIILFGGIVTYSDTSTDNKIIDKKICKTGRIK